jgi:hypothetical protein
MGECREGRIEQVRRRPAEVDMQLLPIQFGVKAIRRRRQRSTQGAAIARVYGRARLAGQVIWATALEEIVSTQTQSSGSKGMGGSAGSTSETTYSYFANFALACARERSAR